MEAAYDLGANRWRALRRVVLPLSMPGIVAGCILAFIPEPRRLRHARLSGGGKTLMIGNLIQSQFGASRNWPFGAALVVSLLAHRALRHDVLPVALPAAPPGDA